MDSSLNTDKLSVLQTPKGLGVFAAAPFAPGDSICHFQGPLVRNEDVPKINENFSNDYYVKISEKYSIGPTDYIEDIFNHSCAPNAGLFLENGEVYLKAIEPISVDDEITFDYSTTLDEDDYNLPCLCGSPQCRKIIGSFFDIDPKRQEYYLEKGAVLPFIANRFEYKV